jgi:FlaA1/EpsC-like NDP-sugar epimerase
MLFSRKFLTINLLFFIDFFLLFFAWLVSYLLRFNFEIPDDYFENMQQNYFIIFLELLLLLFFGLYRGLIRHFSFEDLVILACASIFSALFYSLVSYNLYPLYAVPRSILIINSSLFIVLLGGYRGLYRLLKEYVAYFYKRKYAENVIILGVSEASIALAKEIKKNVEWNLVGFVDSQQNSFSKRVLDFNVIDTFDNLKITLQKFKVKKVLIGYDKFLNQNYDNILEHIGSQKIQILKVPTLNDILNGLVSFSALKQIEIEDLLGRKQVNLDVFKIKKFLKSKKILITGAGGSIGSELCVQLLKFKPDLLICLDLSELALYSLEQKLLGLGFSQAKFLIADVKNKKRLSSIFDFYHPDIVFHVAAYKHVPLTETSNVSEVLINNVIGTFNLAKISINFNVKKFIFISTDKAVNPSNIMGASKHLAELICQSMQIRSKTDFVITRFGNVLGSSGSVIPKFREQISKGGPVTVTHPDVVRFFMSISEAAQLVIQASLMGKKCEIFVLDMGEPIKIVKLAKDMIKLSGFNENEIDIQFLGLRPGEKMYEELLNHTETISPTNHPNLKIAVPQKVSKSLAKDLVNWILSTADKNEVQIKKELKKLVKGYKEV